MRKFILAAALIGAVSTGSGWAAEPTLDVISFMGDLEISLNGEPASLRPGSALYSIPAGGELSIISGDAALLYGRTLVSVKTGDDVLFTAADGSPSLVVKAGRVAIANPNAPRKIFGAGSVIPLALATQALLTVFPLPGYGPGSPENPGSPNAAGSARPAEAEAPIMPPAEP